MATLSGAATARRRFPVGRVLLTVLAALLFAFGWVAGVVWAAVTWMWAALVVGFITARDRS